MAELVDIDFTFPQSKIRQRLSFSPEMALIALLVIAVKIYHPFDAIDRHPRSLNDPGTLATDWDRWCKLQKDYDSRDTARGKLGRGNEIKITESDSFNLSGDQVDEYLDWFEKTFVDEKRARKHPRGYPEQLLEMFPTGKPAGSINTSVDPELERQKDEEALQHKLRTVQGILKMRQVISDDDADLTREPVNRLGSYYERYRKMEDLSCTAKVFHETAANLVSIKLHSLMVAVMQIEHKLLGWQRRQREAALESDSDGMRSQQASEDFPPDFEAVSASDSASMDEDFAMRVHAGDQ